jgi:hypothetical protein
MTMARSVIATFHDQTHHLDVSVGGSGTVTSSPAGIACPGDCTEEVAVGTVVTLTATPEGGSVLSTWAGDCSGTAATCQVTMSGDRSVTAMFGPSQPERKAVRLRAKPKRVDPGGRVRLRAKVAPCEGHEGDVVKFFRKKKRIATKRSNGSCVAKMKVKVRRTTKFRAVSPKQDDDHLAGRSRRVKVRVRRA